MNIERTLTDSRQDYPEKQLYPQRSKIRGNKLREEVDYQGGIFSDSEVGGEARDQQNPWQGSQSRWEQP